MSSSARQLVAVPPALYGRHKGMEALLAERQLLPSHALRSACVSAAERGKASCVPCDGAPAPGLRWGRGRLFERRVAHHKENSCCCKHMLAAQQDFRAEASALQHQIEARYSVTRSWAGKEYNMKERTHHRTFVRSLCAAFHQRFWIPWLQVPGHLCLFLPKFHPELNAIERYWGACKKWLRRHCSYSLPGLRVSIRVALSQSVDDLPDDRRQEDDLPVSPLLKMRRWFRISWQYAAQYRKGSACAEIVRAMAALRSKRHRDMGVGRARPVEGAMEAAAMEGLRRPRKVWGCAWPDLVELPTESV